MLMLTLAWATFNCDGNIVHYHQVIKSYAKALQSKYYKSYRETRDGNMIHSRKQTDRMIIQK